MIIYILRHGIAVPHGTSGIAEDERPLTPEGREKMGQAARGLRKLEVMPDLILTSPLPRAKQTAEIVRTELGEKIPVETSVSLAPSGSRSQVYAELRKRAKDESVMIVGHQPGLGEIAGEIAWGSAQAYLELKKGGVCCLEVSEWAPVPRGALMWLLTPAILRSINRRQ